LGVVGRVPRWAHTRVSVPCWPKRASSSNQTSTRAPGRAAAISATQPGSFFERLLLLRVAFGVARAGAQRPEAQAVQQVVDGLQGAQHTELGFQDVADVLAAQHAHPVGLGGAGAQAVPQPALLRGGERAFAAAAGPVGQQDLGSDGRRSLPQEDEAGGAEAAGDLGPRRGADEGGRLVGSAVRLDVHRGLLPGSRQHTPPAPPQEVISREPYESLQSLLRGGILGCLLRERPLQWLLRGGILHYWTRAET
jgi:hypothetical protein